MNGSRNITFNRTGFIKILEQMSSRLGISASEAIEDIEFSNNTVILKVDNKKAVQRKKVHGARSDIVSLRFTNRDGRG